MGQIQINLYSWWKRKIANAISKIDDNVKHVFGEHNQEADHWANLGVEGQRAVNWRPHDYNDPSQLFSQTFFLHLFHCALNDGGISSIRLHS